MSAGKVPVRSSCKFLGIVKSWVAEKYVKYYQILTFLVNLYRAGFFYPCLPYGSKFRPTWNLGSLLGLS